ncbi:hypothetical protein LOZ80_38725 [Paenibacillus sp. HWE-109]|uniref:hypothetical protein n=1 Tax=Paenibacillus sp. HWE-109 TaxID=1306526 RepID=UPI001EE09A9F|nr:hypothetical protein [Paenibacillus sp. HWE-109]UKS27304.1 hypothetical protein LOZ80_38725 [Paenibacillus sp. HWE-109]
MKIRVNKKERQVIVDDFFQIGGAIVPNKNCVKCGTAIINYDKYDHEFCAYCNTWLKAPCGDVTCIYCSSRPSKRYC